MPRKLRSFRRAALGRLPRALSALLFAIGIWFEASLLRAAEPGATLTVSLLTMGPGEHPFTKFGHTAIWVHDAAGDRDDVYNYGSFAFDSPTLWLDSVAGNLPYWLSVQSLGSTRLGYQEQGRSLVASELELTPSQRSELQALLRDNARPERRYYRYDYYRDNCATRVRDVIDRVLGGEIRRQSLEPARMSYRAHTLRLVADDAPLYVGLDLALGHRTDAPIDFGDEAFLPERLHALLARTRVTHDGRRVPLIRSEHRLLEGEIPVPRPVAPDWRARYFALGLLLGTALLGLGLASRTQRVALRALGASFFGLGVLLGLLGCALAYLSFWSAHAAAASNYNVLLFPPWLLALALAGAAMLRGDARAWPIARWVNSTALLSALIALVCFLIARNPQQNLQEIGFALPVWLGASLASWLGAPRAERRAGMTRARPLGDLAH